MGIFRLMATLLKHPAMMDALILNVPVFEYLLLDYNANIHYILQKTITELNEILYFTYFTENNIESNIIPQFHFINQEDFNMDLDITLNELENIMEKYNEKYKIGTNYIEIKNKLSSSEFVSEIILEEVIKYTQLLICGLNKGLIKKVFIALDGIPSKAKMKEQRNRRFIGAYVNNIKEDITKKFKFNHNHIYQLDMFYYRTRICVGTSFMDNVQKALYNIDIGLDIEISTTYTKGEGEKKIIHELNKNHNNYNSFCVMSPDSDMMILTGLLHNNNKFSGKKFYNFRIDYANKNQYQFFDLEKLVNNFRNYYSSKLNKVIDQDKMSDFFFMLVVFGNDFLPKLEPLDIYHHFDFVCETCLKVSLSFDSDSKTDNSEKSRCHFIENGNLNYKYLLDFFKLINENIVKLSIERSLCEKYANYQKLCQKMSLDEIFLTKYYNDHHPMLKSINVNYLNFVKCRKTLLRSYLNLINYLSITKIYDNDLESLYKDVNMDINDSYLLMILPKILKFPGSQYDIEPKLFFFDFVRYTNSTNNFGEIKLLLNLIVRKFDYYQPKNEGNLSTYLVELNKLNKSLEPYRSIFKIDKIDLFTIDLQSNIITDHRYSYYTKYFSQDITINEINNIVLEYFVGIEWLFQYYINNKYLENSCWEYTFTQPPLIDDIILFLENNLDCHTQISNILSSYPNDSMTPHEHYLYVTPNEYTKANISPNLKDIIHLIDGNGASFINKCQIRWYDT